MALGMYADECVDARIVAGLRRRGIDVVTVADEGLQGAADEQQLWRARELRRVIVTCDHDFLVLARSHLDAGVEFPGVVFILPATVVGDAVRGVALIATLLDAGEMVNRIEWVL
jgi:predicted nuclease of predicted toxin-antitoxin system